MREILRTNDAVVLSYASSVLADEGIEAVIADQHMSILEGSIGIFPRRIMVSPREWSVARRFLMDAGLGEWLLPEPGTHSSP
jgi:hypothetical protein